MIASHSYPECISCPHSILALLFILLNRKICLELIRSVDLDHDNHSCVLHILIWAHRWEMYFWFCWDVLSSECNIETKACFSTGREPINLVSTVLVEHKQKKRIPICYLEDSYTDAIGYYMVYGPIDIPTINAITLGIGNPDAVAILASGFVVLPDEPNKGEEGRNEEWSILSIMFQIIDQNASLDFLPARSVASCYNLITTTANKIQARFASS